jgi:hypothetical protein
VRLLRGFSISEMEQVVNNQQRESVRVQCVTTFGGNMRMIKRNNGQGSTLLEMAAILPILFSLTFGVIDFGRYFYASSAVFAAAQAGARAGLGEHGIVDPVAAEKVAREQLVTFDHNNLTIITQQPNLETIEVQIIYQFEFFTPFLAPMFPGNALEIRGGATMVSY